MRCAFIANLTESNSLFQVTYEMQFQHHPLLILNNFTGDEKHLEIMSKTFQNMFPSININKIQLRAIRRVLMLNYNEEDDTVDLRHYTITVSFRITLLLLGQIFWPFNLFAVCFLLYLMNSIGPLEFQEAYESCSWSTIRKSQILVDVKILLILLKSKSLYYWQCTIPTLHNWHQFNCFNPSMAVRH
jgi:hypothetical protein